MQRPLITLLFACSHFLPLLAAAQTGGVGIGTTTPASSAALDVSSTTKGFLPPRMTWSQIQAIQNPTPGLTVYDIGAKALRLWDSARWKVLGEQQKEMYEAPGTFSDVGSSTGFSDFALTAIEASVGKSQVLGGRIYGASGTFGTIALTGEASANSGVVAKIDSMGNPLWAFMLRGSGTAVEVKDVAVDAAGNVYVCGFFSGTVDFNPGGGVNSLTGTGYQTGFFAKYDMNGNYAWAKMLAGSSTAYCYANRIATDGTTLFVYGEFSRTGVNFGGTTLSPTGDFDNFLARYSASTGTGLSGWQVIKIGSSAAEQTGGLEMYGSGGALISGSFTGSCSFNGTTLVSNAAADGIFCVVNSFGVCTPYKIGGPGAQKITDVTSDAGGNIYVAGNYDDSVDLDPTAAVSWLVNPYPGASNQGAAFYWYYYNTGAYSYYGYPFASVYGSRITDIELDSVNGIFVTGTHYPTGSSSTDPPAYGREDIFLFKIVYDYYAGYYPQWRAYAGSNGYEAPNISTDIPGPFISVSANGKVIFSAGQLDDYYGTKYVTFGRQQLPMPGGGLFLSRYEE